MASTRRPMPAPVVSRTGRREVPVAGPAGCPKVAFARELRALRDRIGTPTYTKLAERAPVSGSALSRAADGTRQPTWAVAKAYVLACQGDVEHFKRLYVSLFGRLR